MAIHAVNRIWRLVLLLAIASTPSAAAITRKSQSRVRGSKGLETVEEEIQYHRALKGPGGKGNRLSSYIGCLGLDSSEMDSSWIFPGDVKGCKYTHHTGGDDDGSSGGGGDDDSSGGGGGDDDNGGGGNDDGVDEGGNDDDKDGRNSGEDEEVSEEDFENSNGDDDGGDDGDGGDYDPYEDFDIEQCDTFENLWIWDLSLTCDGEEDLSSCECVFAEELLGLELLSCEDASLCPAECPICSTCMQLMGCTTVTTGIKSGRTSNTVFVLAAGIGLVVFGLIYFVARRNRGNSDLATHLMEDEEIDQPEDFPGSLDDDAPTVWLAPDVAEAAQFEAAARVAALGAGVVATSDGSVSSSDETTPMCILSAPPTFTPPPEDEVWLAPIT
jgi:hypothetical protein